MLPHSFVLLCISDQQMGSHLRKVKGSLDLGLIWFPGAAISKYHSVSGLNSRNLLSHSSGGQTSKIKVPWGLLPSEAVRKTLVCSPGFWWLAGNHQDSLACGSISLISALVFTPALPVCVCVQISPFHKNTSYTGLRFLPILVS